ncbi:MAG TPA: hypothetical protein DCR55_17760 [Lentisphaeria bacterium]|nr:hypothetical protein [Lentisphaeria bacterium]
MKHATTILMLLFAALAVWQTLEISHLRQDLAAALTLPTASPVLSQPAPSRPIPPARIPAEASALASSPLPIPTAQSDVANSAKLPEFSLLFELLELSPAEAAATTAALHARGQGTRQRPSGVIDARNGQANHDGLKAALGEKYPLFKQYEPMLHELEVVARLHQQLTEMELPLDRQQWISLAGILHDIGLRGTTATLQEAAANVLDPKQQQAFNAWLRARD